MEFVVGGSMERVLVFGARNFNMQLGYDRSCNLAR